MNEWIAWLFGRPYMWTEQDFQVLNGKLDAILSNVQRIQQKETFIMALADDLNNAVTALATAAAASDAAVQAELVALTAAMATEANPATQAAVAQAVSNIGTITATIAK